MKKHVAIRYIGLSICLVFCCLFVFSQSAGTKFLHRLSNPAVVWEDMPYLRTGVQVWSHTSKSPFNRTVQDFLNYTTMDGDYYESANYQGRGGMLVHSWFAFLSRDTTGWLKIYNSPTPAPGFNMPVKAYFNTGVYPHTLWETKDGIWWAFPGMAFQRRFKATTSLKPQWYQYTLHTYREKKYAESIDKNELTQVQKKMQSPGSFPGAVAGDRHKTLQADIAAGGSNTIFESGSPGVIRQIHFTPANTRNATMDSVFIHIITDGKTTAYLPICMFFGGYPKTNVKNAGGLPAGFDGKSLYNYFPMPYWKSFRMELENRSATVVDFSIVMNWSGNNPYPVNATGTFNVQYNARTPVTAGEPDFVNLAVDGSGLMVGAVSQLTGAIEANFSIYVDGMKTPAIESTGGEDYFNHAYGIHPGFIRPFSGGLGDTAAYRFHTIDYIPFLRSLRFTQDHAEYKMHDRNGIFNSAVFYYLNRKQYLALTDSIDVGKETSEKLHRYEVTEKKGPLITRYDTAAYESDFSSLFADEGRWIKGSSSFTAGIDPANTGVRLRRRINQSAYHQELKVYVDNQPAGTWFEQGANYQLNKRMYYNDSLPAWEKGNIEALFRDTEFNIPAALTAGKRMIRVRMETVKSLAVQPADAGFTNEYFYWVYSYLPFN